MWFGTKGWKDSLNLVFPPFLSFTTQILYLPSRHQYCIYLQGLFDGHESNVFKRTSKYRIITTTKII